MSDYYDGDDYLYWEREKLVAPAVRKLIERHRDEYDELAGDVTRKEIERLERQIDDLQREIKSLIAMNPHGTNVPALEQTANMLVEENTRLARRSS